MDLPSSSYKALGTYQRLIAVFNIKIWRPEILFPKTQNTEYAWPLPINCVCCKIFNQWCHLHAKNIHFFWHALPSIQISLKGLNRVWSTLRDKTLLIIGFLNTRIQDIDWGEKLSSHFNKYKLIILKIFSVLLEYVPHLTIYEFPSI